MANMNIVKGADMFQTRMGTLTNIACPRDQDNDVSRKVADQIHDKVCPEEKI